MLCMDLGGASFLFYPIYKYNSFSKFSHEIFRKLSFYSESKSNQFDCNRPDKIIFGGVHWEFKNSVQTKHGNLNMRYVTILPVLILWFHYMSLNHRCKPSIQNNLYIFIPFRKIFSEKAEINFVNVFRVMQELFIWQRSSSIYLNFIYSIVRLLSVMLNWA